MITPYKAEPVCRVKDNPILLAQARRRLRFAEARFPVLMTGVLCLFAVLLALAGKETPEKTFRYIQVLILAGMGVVLYFRSTLVVVATMVWERASGILDFHRAAPPTSWTNALGYAFGCSAREWLLVGVMLPFFLLSSILSEIPFINGLLGLMAVCLTGALCQVFALWMGMAGSSKKKATGGVTAVALLLILFGGSLRESGLCTVAFLTPLPALASLGIMDYPTLGSPVDFVGFPVPPVLFTVVVQLHMIVFLGWASARKLETDDASSFSRVGSLLFYATGMALILGGAWNAVHGPGKDVLSAQSSVALTASAHLLGSALLVGALLANLAPDPLYLIRTLRRARQRGRSGLGLLEDGASTLPLVVPFVVLAAAGMGLIILGGSSHIPLSSMLGMHTWLGLTSMAALMVFIAGAAEYAVLTMKSASRSGAWWIAFVAVVVPLLLAALLSLVTGEHSVALYVAALSPAFPAYGLPNLLMEWTTPPKDGTPVTLIISIAVTAVSAAWFWSQVFARRTEIAERVARGSGVGSR